MLSIKTSSETFEVLVIVAHPDDEWWGLGGTLLYLRSLHCQVRVIMVSDGERGDNTGHIRMRKSMELCHNNEIFFELLKIPANSLDLNIPKIVKELDQFFLSKNPGIVFSHYEKDVHQDHVAVHKAVLSSLRNHPNVTFFQIETPFKYDFAPNFFIDISKFNLQKEKLYSLYFEDEIKRRKEYTTYHMNTVSRMRGLESNVEYAEGFILKRGFI